VAVALTRGVLVGLGVLVAAGRAVFVRVGVSVFVAGGRTTNVGADVVAGTGEALTETDADPVDVR
jgi:hypothetical protein